MTGFNPLSLSGAAQAEGRGDGSGWRRRSRDRVIHCSEVQAALGRAVGDIADVLLAVE